MKYIMLITDEGQHLPFIFPEHLVHADVAEFLRMLVAQATKRMSRLESAGFVTISEAITHGESESTGKQSRVIDGKYIELGDAVAMLPPDMLKLVSENIDAKMKDLK